MKVILLQNVKGVGQKGEVKEVSEGYARNRLIPQGLAKSGTEGNLKEVQKLSADKKKHRKIALEKIESAFKVISGAHIEILVQANELGALFAKFDEKNLLKEIEKNNYKGITLKHIQLKDSPLKHIGKYTAVLKEENLTSSFTFELKTKST